MSREIQFRAKRLDNNQLVIGYYLPTQYGEKHFIYFALEFLNEHTRIEIDPKTLGQYTGFVDINGKEIFEGDIIKIDNKHAPLGYIIKTVLFKNGMFGVSEDAYSFISLKEFFVGVESTKKYISNYGEIFKEYKAIFEVIGNIYEHKELITEVKNV